MPSSNPPAAGAPPVSRLAGRLLLSAKVRVKHALEKAAVRYHIVSAEDGYRGHPDQAFGGSTYAQFGEDLIILNIFHLLGIKQPSYLDVGAHHPLNVSNTALLHLRGSRGINVDANPNLIAAFREQRPDDVSLNVGVGPERGTLNFYFIDDWSGRNTFRREVAEEFVRENPQFQIRDVKPIPVVTLNDIVDQHAGGRFPDFLSMDVEGLDFDILSSATFGERGPSVICVEAVSGADSDDSARLTGVLAGHGYVLFVRTVGNLIFVRGDQAAKLGLPGAA